jgi:gluconolactonase
MAGIIEAKSPAIHQLVAADAAMERVAGGLGFTEGPVWVRDHLLFSDIPNGRICRWRSLPEGPELTTFALGQSNGLTLDLQGRVLAAEHYGRQVSRVDAGGGRTTLADRYEGKRLNSPNDIVVKSDGSVYFTDPPYGLLGQSGQARPERWWTLPLPGKELDVHGVYRLGPDGDLSLVAGDFVLPNGLMFSPDEALLYINDSQQKHIRVFDVRSDGSLANGRVFLDMDAPEPGVPDGMKLDLAGNVFCTGPGGIWVVRPNGELLGRILVPEIPANVAWGEDGSTLFITARTSVYRLRTLTKGRLLV